MTNLGTLKNNPRKRIGIVHREGRLCYLAFMVGISVSLASLILSVFLKPVKK